MTEEVFRLLQAIDDTGSLRAAAEKCGLSYRHGWGLLQKWQRLLEYPLARMERGRGAVVTELGRKLLAGRKRIAARMEPDLQRLTMELAEELDAVIDSGKPHRLRIAASHGLVIAMLGELADALQDLPLDIQIHGSLDSLRLLKAGRCEVAGFHIPNGRLGTVLLPRFRRLLNPAQHALIRVVQRRQGIMTAPGNPKGIDGLQDLQKRTVRFINRQRNSGTRTTLDLLLDEARLDPEQIIGYSAEEFTHLAVAAMVASGGADAAFGLEAAAARFKLHFIPCNWENYWFVLQREALDSQPLAGLLAVLRSKEFSERVTRFPGYRVIQPGCVVSLDAGLSELVGDPRAQSLPLSSSPSQSSSSV